MLENTDKFPQGLTLNIFLNFKNIIENPLYNFSHLTQEQIYYQYHFIGDCFREIFSNWFIIETILEKKKNQRHQEESREINIFRIIKKINFDWCCFSGRRNLERFNKTRKSNQIIFFRTFASCWNLDDFFSFPSSLHKKKKEFLWKMFYEANQQVILRSIWFMYRKFMSSANKFATLELKRKWISDDLESEVHGRCFIAFSMNSNWYRMENLWKVP